MKALIILSLTILSLNVFGAEVGQNLKSDCTAGDQSNRSAKKVEVTQEKEEVKKESKAVSK